MMQAQLMAIRTQAVATVATVDAILRALDDALAIPLPRRGACIRLSSGSRLAGWAHECLDLRGLWRGRERRERGLQGRNTPDRWVRP